MKTGTSDAFLERVAAESRPMSRPTILTHRRHKVLPKLAPNPFSLPLSKSVWLLPAHIRRNIFSYEKTAIEIFFTNNCLIEILNLPFRTQWKRLIIDTQSIRGEHIFHLHHVHANRGTSLHWCRFCCNLYYPIPDDIVYDDDVWDAAVLAMGDNPPDYQEFFTTFDESLDGFYGEDFPHTIPPLGTDEEISQDLLDSFNFDLNVDSLLARAGL
jgi:hypothetical protein